MAISLSKGGNISLSKTDPTLKNVVISLGWDARPTTDGQDFDLDASAFWMGENADNDFIFYNQLKSSGGSGDNRTGDGDGDETLILKLDWIPSNVERISFTVTIHDAIERKQNFGQVRNAYIRIINTDGNVELARYDLSEDASTETAMIFGELYRNAGDWKFRAVGQGYAGGLAALAKNYGINILPQKVTPSCR